MRTAHLSGRLGDDPNVRSMQNSDYSVLAFSIANGDESRKDQNGEYQNVTSWFDVEYWTKNPQKWINDLKKGTLIAVECDVKQDRWQDDNGNNRQRIKFIVKRGGFPLVVQQPQGTQPTEQNQQPEQSKPPEDDVPF